MYVSVELLNTNNMCYQHYLISVDNCIWCACWLGATVGIKCMNRNSMSLAYSVEGVTDANGTYNILIEDDHEDQICESVLVSSPISDCKSADPGRSRANVVLTRFNGVVKTKRFANNMGFFKDQALPECTELLKQYLNYDQPE